MATWHCIAGSGTEKPRAIFSEVVQNSPEASFQTNAAQNGHVAPWQTNVAPSGHVAPGQKEPCGILPKQTFQKMPSDILPGRSGTEWSRYRMQKDVSQSDHMELNPEILRKVAVWHLTEKMHNATTRYLARQDPNNLTRWHLAER